MTSSIYLHPTNQVFYALQITTAFTTASRLWHQRYEYLDTAFYGRFKYHTAYQGRRIWLDWHPFLACSDTERSILACIVPLRLLFELDSPICLAQQF